MRKLFLLLAILPMINFGQIVSTTPMKFSCGKSDTIYIYVASDTLYNNVQLYVSCTKHQHKSWKSITIGFVDGDMLEVDAGGCYSITDTEKLRNTKFDYISFDEMFSSLACINIRSKDYFLQFFNNVQK